MTKWEYQWIIKDNIQALDRELNYKGSQGWELVNVMVTPISQSYAAFLKRPIAS